MKNKSIYLILLVLIAGLVYVFARQQLEAPQVTEVWDIVPVAVVPGAIPGAPPSDAVILFDGTSLDGWEAVGDSGPAGWTVAENSFTVEKGTGDIKTRRSFGDVQLHIEWCSPAEVKGDGQGRGNSGIFLQERYEIQILDSYENETYPNGQAGSVYKQHVPLVNATLPPGEWQYYDIVFLAPRFSDDGRVLVPARVTIFHNGMLIQNNVEIWGPTEYIGLPVYKPHGKAPIKLQDHGDPVSFRNIWLREL